MKTALPISERAVFGFVQGEPHFTPSAMRLFGAAVSFVPVMVVIVVPVVRCVGEHPLVRCVGEHP